VKLNLLWFVIICLPFVAPAKLMFALRTDPLSCRVHSRQKQSTVVQACCLQRHPANSTIFETNFNAGLMRLSHERLWEVLQVTLKKYEKLGIVCE
jgi:hypothetical protein